MEVTGEFARVIHNINDETGRLQALDEIRRVLRPGGVLALADIQHVPRYAEHLRKTGWRVEAFDDGGVEAVVMGVLSGGTYRPQTLLARRPEP